VWVCIYRAETCTDSHNDFLPDEATPGETS
jgi:hypothetical protein